MVQIFKRTALPVSLNKIGKMLDADDEYDDAT
jgi:hypothetical protein